MADFTVNYKHHYTPHLVDDSDEKGEGICWELRVFSLLLLRFTWRCCCDVISARETTEAREKILNQILRRHESSIGHQKCFLIEEIYKHKEKKWDCVLYPKIESKGPELTIENK